ncbi:MAG TPA: CARDB domain-containing protein [Gemmatimonadaceae bacterium]
MTTAAKLFLAVSAAVSISYSLMPTEATRIKRKETVNFSNLVSSVETVYVAPGKTKEYTLYGPWLDFASKVTFMGSDQPITERMPLPFTSDAAKIKVKMTGSGSRALRTATISIVCPPFTDCVSTHTFPVRVLSQGTISSITPDQGVAPNSNQHFRIVGTNLDNATVFLFRTDLRAVSNVSNSDGWLEFNASTSSCGSNRVMVRDAAEGGDFYPFTGSLDVRLSTTCDGRILSSPSIITGSSQPAGPDLQATGGSPVFRHVAPNRKLLSEPFCHGMFAQAVQAIVKTIDVPDITWSVKNAGGTNVTQTFHARLFRNGIQVADSIVNGLNAGATKTFTYHRPQSQTEVARLGLVPPQTTMQLYNATGGECVQTVGQATQYDWQDPAYEIRIDVVANETNQTNNRRSF